MTASPKYSENLPSTPIQTVDIDWTDADIGVCFHGVVDG